MNVRQGVVFAILMQGNKGIMTKHPSYLAEKLAMCLMGTTPERMLDASNLKIFNDWKQQMRIEFTDDGEVEYI